MPYYNKPKPTSAEIVNEELMVERRKQLLAEQGKSATLEDRVRGLAAIGGKAARDFVKAEAEVRELKALLAGTGKAGDKLYKCVEDLEAEVRELKKEERHLGEMASKLICERGDLLAERDKLLALLRELEWCCGDYSICPVCNSDRYENNDLHLKDCAVGNALKESG